MVTYFWLERNSRKRLLHVPFSEESFRDSLGRALHKYFVILFNLKKRNNLV